MAAKNKGLLIVAIVGVVLGVVAAIGVAVAAVAIFWTTREPTLAEIGGTELVVRTDAASRDEVVEVYRRRLDSLDLHGETNIVADGDDGIVVQVAGPVDGDLLIRALLLQAKLEFREVSTAANTFDLTQQAEGWIAEQGAAGRQVTNAEVDAWLADQVLGDLEVMWSYETDPMTGRRSRSEVHALHPDVRVDGSMVKTTAVEFDTFGAPYVALEFDETGRGAFCQLTGDITGSLLAIVLDGEVMSAPRVVEPICGGQAHITLGSASLAVVEQEAQLLAAALRAGVLPAEVTLESTRVISPAP